MNLLTKILAFLAALATAAAAFLGLRAKNAKQEADHQRQRADAAETAADLRRRIDNTQRELEDKHREQQRESDERLKAGRRDHLDKHW